MHSLDLYFMNASPAPLARIADPAAVWRTLAPELASAKSYRFRRRGLHAGAGIGLCFRKQPREDLMDGAVNTLDFDPDALRERYRQERDRRLRADGNNQYIEVAQDFGHYIDD